MTTGLARTLLRGFAVGALAAGLAAAPATGQQQPAPQPQAQDAPEIEQDELETVAEAYVEISEIRAQMQTELQSADDSQQATEIQQRADQQMQQVLQDHGIAIERYQEVIQILNSDPEQRQAFQEVLQEIQDG